MSESSSAQREAPCPLHTACGGCPTMVWDEVSQRANKVAQIEEVLGQQVDETVCSPRQLGYRCRVSLKPNRDGVLGYHRPRSHIHVPIDQCAIAREEINAVLGALPPLTGWKSAELRTDGSRVVLHLSSGKKRGTRGPKATLDEAGLRAAGVTGAAVDGSTAFGQTRLVVSVEGIEHQWSVDTFFQVNAEINQALVARVGQAVRNLQPAGVLDLYAGAGNLSLPLAKDGISLTLLESNPAAVNDAKRTVKRLQLPGVTIQKANAGQFKAGQCFFDVAILDPPRKGAPGVIDQLLVTRPRGIVYVSCHAPALARDIRPATDAGYQLQQLTAFDMFPQTDHTEVLAVVVRPDVASSQEGSLA